MDKLPKPWESWNRCGVMAGRGSGRTPAPCPEYQIEGLGACLLHVPASLLDEAEEVTGLIRCRGILASGELCPKMAEEGSSPPRCRSCGGGTGRQITARNVIGLRSAERLRDILSEETSRLLTALAVDNPLDELLQLAGEIKQLKEILRVSVSRMSVDQWRYLHDRTGEQFRAEILLYERATERLGHLLVQIAKLNIESKLAAISERQAQVVEDAIKAGIAAAGGDLEQQEKARKAVVLHLRKAG